MEKICVLFASLLSSFLYPLHAKEILVNTERGACILLEVFSNDTLADVVHETQAILGNHQAKYLWIELPLEGDFEPQPVHWTGDEASVNHGQFLGHPRMYVETLDEELRKNVYFIVNFLANRSIIVIMSHQNELQEAGDRIDQIHPLNFLKTVFTDEQLKVDIRNIRGKSLIWPRFIGGIKESLQTEMNIGNMLQYVPDFSNAVQVDCNLIMPLVATQKWDELIDTLIAKVPRKGDHNRYDN